MDENKLITNFDKASKIVLGEDKELFKRLAKEKPLEIKCPHCGYDGSDLKIGRRQVTVTNTGVPRVLCSKCGRYFVIQSNG